MSSKCTNNKNILKFSDRFTITGINTVNTFILKLNDNKTKKNLDLKCIICQGFINESSPNYIDVNKESDVVTGLCGHSFHHDCIMLWTNHNEICPLCTDKKFVIMKIDKKSKDSDNNLVDIGGIDGLSGAGGTL
jgi:hypothetical protein